MDALEECHRQEFLKQALGACNFEKEELTKCLHYTRVNDANERINKSRERSKRIDTMRKQAQEEVYGKNNYLKKLVELEIEKKK